MGKYNAAALAPAVEAPASTNEPTESRAHSMSLQLAFGIRSPRRVPQLKASSMSGLFVKPVKDAMRVRGSVSDSH